MKSGGSARRRGEILIGRELHHVIGQVAAAHGTKCIKEDGCDNTMEPDLPPCLQECCQEVWQGWQAEEEGVLRHLHLEGYQGCQQVQHERLQISSATATRRLMLPRELPKDAIYIYKATKAVDKYSRRGYKEVRQWRQEGLCCPERCPMTPRELASVPKKDS